MAKILLFSDSHIDQLFSDVEMQATIKCLDEIDRYKKRGYIVIAAGDIFNVLENGMGLFEDVFCSEVKERCGEWEWLQGNHDRLPELPDHLIIDNCYFCHGHQFELLWGWIPIRVLPVPAFIQRLYRTPAQKKGKLNDYQKATTACEYQATIFMVKNQYKLLGFGHTHSPVEMNREGYILTNDGDLVDSKTVELINTETYEFKREVIG